MRKKFFKKSLALLCSLAIVLSAGACGQKGTGKEDAPVQEDASVQNDTAKEADAPVTLRFAWWGNQDRNDKTMQIIDLYKQVAPNVTIEAEMSGWGDYFTKLATQAAGNNLPDLIQICDPYTSQYASKSQLADMTGLMEYFDAESIDKSVLDAGVFNDKMVMMPVGLNALGLIYDPTVYEKAGARVPTKDWTWDEFIESARKIHDATGTYGSSYFDPNIALDQWLNSYGYNLLSEDGKSLGYTDDTLLQKYFEMVLKLQDDGIIPSPDLYSQRTVWEDGFLVAHEAPNIWQYANNLPALNALVPGLEIGFVPSTEQGSAVSTQLRASMGIGIAESSKNKEEAMKFINFLINNLDANNIEKAERGIPISSKVRADMKQSLTEEQAKMFDFIDQVSANCKMQPNQPEAAANVEAAFADVNEQVLYKVISPEEGAKQFRKAAEEAIALLNNK